MIRTISPTTNQVLVETLETSLDNARQIAQLSKLAFSKWAELPLAHRKELVAKAVVKLHQKKDQLALELTQQMGRPIRSAGVEIDTMKKRADYLLSISENALSDLPGTIEHGFRRWTRKIATGPTLLVFPWNVGFSRVS